MTFCEHRCIDFMNVLSYRTRVDMDRLENLISYIRQNMDALGLEIMGDIVFTVSEVIESVDKKILGIEILVPVDKAFESREQYVYKPRFRLVNAVSVCLGGSNDFIKAKDELLQYLDKHHLNAASSVYFMQSGGGNFSECSPIYDAIVSVNDNMV